MNDDYKDYKARTEFLEHLTDENYEKAEKSFSHIVKQRIQNKFQQEIAKIKKAASR